MIKCALRCWYEVYANDLTYIQVLINKRNSPCHSIITEMHECRYNDKVLTIHLSLPLREKSLAPEQQQKLYVVQERSTEQAITYKLNVCLNWIKNFLQQKLTNAVFGAGYIYPYDVRSLGRLTGMSQRCRLRHDPFRKPSLFLCRSSSESVRVLRFSYILNTIDQCINTEAHIHLTSSAYKHRQPINIHGATA